MCHFMFLSDMGGPRWVIMGMVVKLAQSVSTLTLFPGWLLNVLTTNDRLGYVSAFLLVGLPCVRALMFIPLSVRSG